MGRIGKSEEGSKFFSDPTLVEKCVRELFKRGSKHYKIINFIICCVFSLSKQIYVQHWCEVDLVSRLGGFPIVGVFPDSTLMKKCVCELFIRSSKHYKITGFVMYCVSSLIKKKRDLSRLMQLH